MAQEKFTLTTTTKLFLGSLRATRAIKNNNSAIAGFEHGTYKSQDPLIQLRSIGTSRCGWPNMPRIPRVEIGCMYLPKIGPHIPVRSGVPCIPMYLGSSTVVKL